MRLPKRWWLGNLGTRGWTIGAVVIFLVVSTLSMLPSRTPPASSEQGIIVVDAATPVPSVAAVSPRTSGEIPMPLVAGALGIGADARFRIPPDAPSNGPILCGDVRTGAADMRWHRFVFNRSAETGAVDDGTPLFQAFADKICKLR